MSSIWAGKIVSVSFSENQNELISLCFIRIQVVVDTSIRECQAHKELQGEVAADMERTAADIAVLKEQVAHERVIRANKEEYAILAKQAEKLPPRSKTEKDKASGNRPPPFLL
jgi:hypothetical protein